jgi:hypothetical protein
VAEEQATGEAETETPERIAEPEAEGSADRPAEDLPVYGWLQRVTPAQPEDVNSLRGLVQAKEDKDEEPAVPE